MTDKHVIPIGGKEPEHNLSTQCWCYPLEIEPGIWTHNAKDCREKFERRGIRLNDGRTWILVEQVKF
jgi:hypothetical protein